MTHRELGNLVIAVFVAWIVWLNYRKATFTPGEKYATFWPRFWTGWVDSVVLWPLGFVVGLLVLLHPPAFWDVVLTLASNAAGLAYTVSMHARRGQTVGKIVCKVRVVSYPTEGPISLRQALLRECVPLIANLGVLGYLLYLTASGALTGQALNHPDKVIHWPTFGLLAITPALWFLIEVVTMFSNEKRRALHDLIANTVVVRTHLSEAQPPALVEALTP